jgi:glutaminase
LLKIESVLNEIEAACRVLKYQGQPASYIAPLAQVQRDFGIAFCHDGVKVEAGARARFSVQSITKIMTLVYAIHRYGAGIWDVVGVNATGRPFNDLSLLESERLPRNPCVNAGALAVSAFLHERGDLQELTGFISRISGDEVRIDEAVAVGEMQDCANNRRICEMLQANSVINRLSDVENILWYYCQQCAISMNCAQIARTLELLSNDGRIAGSSEQVISPADAAKVNAVMVTAGNYDNAGQIFVDIQAPAKSGVGGGIVAVYPGHGTVCAWSPGLDEFGNSVAAQAALAMFTEITGWSILG